MSAHVDGTGSELRSAAHCLLVLDLAADPLQLQLSTGLQLSSLQLGSFSSFALGNSGCLDLGIKCDLCRYFRSCLCLLGLDSGCCPGGWRLWGGRVGGLGKGFCLSLTEVGFVVRLLFLLLPTCTYAHRSCLDGTHSCSLYTPIELFGQKPFARLPNIEPFRKS